MTKHKTYLRQLLLARSDWMEKRLHAEAERNGYSEITEAMSRLCAHLVGRPVGLSELSRRLGVSRQAAHKLSKEIARLGFVEFIASETDARVLLVRFTQKGWDMADSATRQLEAIEAEIVREIGEEKMETLKTLLAIPWTDDEKAAEP